MSRVEVRVSCEGEDRGAKSGAVITFLGSLNDYSWMADCEVDDWEEKRRGWALYIAARNV